MPDQRDGVAGGDGSQADGRTPRVGIVSLGCPKALVDSERILTRLRAEGYELSGRYEDADAVIVNTCGFLDSAREESLEAIGEAIRANGRVIVTGCLGTDAEGIRARHPQVLAVTGPHQYESVVAAVHEAVPPAHHPFLDLVPPQGLRLTPRHYAYLKISEGCNNRCSFCIIPALRGRLASRPLAHVMHEAEKLAAAGVKELLVISQDTSAYGTDLRHEQTVWRDRPLRTHFLDLCEALGELGIWIRLHYVYPYPHVDRIIPLMAEGKLLPYLDMPLQHASPTVLRAMRRPADEERMLERLRSWRANCPDLNIRSTFIVGFPGETEEDFRRLLDWLEAAELDRVGCFRYEPVTGAAANALPDPVPDEIKEERWHRFMRVQQRVSAARLKRKVGRTMTVLVDRIEADGTAVARSAADAPEIDGSVRIDHAGHARVGDFIKVRVEAAGDYDLVASLWPPRRPSPMRRGAGRLGGRR